MLPASIYSMAFSAVIPPPTSHQSCQVMAMVPKLSTGSSVLLCAEDLRCPDIPAWRPPGYAFKASRACNDGFFPVDIFVGEVEKLDRRAAALFASDAPSMMACPPPV